MARVCIIGPGAVGATLACSARKLPITAIGRRPETIEVHGLCPGYTFNSIVWSDSIGDCLPVFVSVKAHQTPLIMNWFNRIHSPLIIVVQNGFYGLEIIERNVNNSVIAGGVAEFGATRHLNRVEVRGSGKLIVGCKDWDCRDDLQFISTIMDAPVHVEITKDITPWRWLKAIINSVINTLTAIYDVPNGALLVEERLTRLAHSLTLELSSLVENRGVNLPVDPHKYLKKVLIATRDNISSTLQDLRNCRVPEIGWIVYPFLESSKTLTKVFNSVIKVFLSRCGIRIPLPEDRLTYGLLQ
jgi:2-dehydropantoate 2-reductase